MSFFSRFKHRSVLPELMDLPDVDRKKLIRTVKQFKILNRLFSASRRLLKKNVYRDMLKQGKKTYTFLDLGSGGCDIPIWLIRKCRKKNIHLKVTCLDSDKSIQTYAREITAGYPEITLILGDAFELDQLPDFDYIFSNHFLHHLPDEKITPLIENVARKTKRAFLFNDLYRSPWAYLGYTLAASLFFHKSLAFYDGRLSIRKGFTLKEILQLTEKTRLSCSVQAFKTLPARICILGKNRIKHKESRKY